MKLAARRIERGERVPNLPHELAVFMVAAAFGSSPAAVREWPAADFLFAVRVLGVLR